MKPELPSVACYPIPGKAKAERLCRAFADGVVASGGTARLYGEPPKALKDGAAVFYGVRPSVAHLWDEAQRRGRDWFYIDNSYLDVARERCFRVTRNALQMTAPRPSDGARLRALGVKVKPWRRDGRHILLCEQSAEFMDVVAGDRAWADRIVEQLRGLSGRPIIRRRKGDTVPLAAALEGAWAVVTWSSAAAVEALVAGIPVICSPECAAAPFSMAPFEIESPPLPDGREAWAAALADSQWTLDELRAGLAWKALA